MFNIFSPSSSCIATLYSARRLILLIVVSLLMLRDRDSVVSVADCGRVWMSNRLAEFSDSREPCHGTSPAAGAGGGTGHYTVDTKPTRRNICCALGLLCFLKTFYCSSPVSGNASCCTMILWLTSREKAQSSVSYRDEIRSTLVLDDSE